MWFKPRGQLLFALGVSAVSCLLLAPAAEAVPAFARTTGMACMSCHAQSFPALNAFGRSYRAQGYTLQGSATQVEDEDLAIPADLKASLVVKLRYQVHGDVDGGRGEIQWPDEAALLIGGRASDKVGYLLEAGLGPMAGEADTGTGEVTFTDVTAGGCATDPTDPALCTVTADTGSGEVGADGNFLSFKTHFNVSDEFAMVLFGTDGLGVGYGMELMNTGAQRSQRPIENRSGFSAGQRLGTASGGATGVAFVYHTNDFMVNYSHWAPTWGNVNANILGGLAHYLRINYFINEGGWDMGFGANWMDGSIDTGETDPATVVNVASHGVDFQAIGELFAMPAEFYVSYGVAPKGSVSEPETFNTSTTQDKTAYGLLGKFGVAKRTSAYLAYGSTDNGATSVNDVTLGLMYMLAQNIKFELYNVSNSTSDNSRDYTMLQMFAAF